MFEDIMLDIRAGSRVRRKEWDTFEYIYLSSDDYGNPMFCNSMGYVYNISSIDVLSDDWETVDD